MTCHEAQKNGGIYTGIVGIQAQDQPVTESIVPITDHDFENLSPSDIMIPRTRRRLSRAARHRRPRSLCQVRSGDFLADEKISWREPTICNPAQPSAR